MTYVVYNKDTTRLLHFYDLGLDKEYFATEAAAKGALTRAMKNTKIVEAALTKDDFRIADRNRFFESIERKEVRKGVVHAAGQDFEVGVNTPWTSGPWSETYFSS